MKEIPVFYVRTNQLGILIFIAIAVIFKQPLIFLALWIIQTLGLTFGSRMNLFVAAARLFFQERAQKGKREAIELNRFNNMLAVSFISLSLLSFAFGWTTTGYIFAGMLFLAAFMAFLGFCIGCVIYFQIKQLKHKLKKGQA